MKVVITGGAGFIGRRLARRILEKGTLAGPDGAQQDVSKLVLFDIVEAEGFDDPRVEAVAGDVADWTQIDGLIGHDTGSIFHLAAIVSAQAEEDYDLGMRINLDGTRHVLEAARAMAHTPRLVFASSIAVYGGGDLPETVTDGTPVTPLTSYGAAKACGEQLVSDMSRKGFIDGRSLRLPTICVRTGKPNRAASTWVSSMIREPLCGEDMVVPVSPESKMSVLSPRRVVEAFIAAHEAPADKVGDWRSLLLSGITVSAGEIAEAVERNRGNRKVGAIRFQPDPAIQKIVNGWPGGARGARAEALGIGTDASIDEIVRHFIEDDLDNQMQGIF
ncbi:MAG: D-erythronate dehydrogenase [Minwuia sp.]|uniref:D-erythronate dehydrogenase n=1 Tax=Minwuia sp. TaxID=2493630 RepID=UPI003A88BF5B